MIRLLFLFLAAAVTPPGGVASATPLGAGSDAHGWIVLPVRDSESTDAVAWLYHLPGDAPPGGARRVLPLYETPTALSAANGELLLVFERAEDAVDLPERRRPVRRIGVAAQSMEGLYFYTPPDRLGVLPSLPPTGEFLDLVAIDNGAAALLRAGGEMRLLMLEGLHWRDVSLPAGLDPAAEGALVHDGDDFAIMTARSGGEATVWVAEAPAGDDSEPGDGDKSATSAGGEIANGTSEGMEEDASAPIRFDWRRETIPIPATDAEVLGGGGSRLVVTRRGERRDVQLARRDRLYDLATLDSIPEHAALFSIGSEVVFAWVDEEDEAGRLRLIYLADTGKILYDDYARPTSPVSPGDLRFLGVLLGAIVLTVIVFVLKPAAASRPDVVLPEGAVLADPWARFGAALIDLLPGVLIAGQVWSVGFNEVLARPFTVPGPEGVWPLMTALAFMFVHSSLSEALWGRTLGKMIVRLRTISVTGEAPTLWQAVSRNIVKMLAPPLIVLLLVDPRRRHPGDFLSGTLVIATPRDGDSGEEALVDEEPGSSG